MRSTTHEKGKWDAENYHKVSFIQEAWALELISKRKWKGNEVLIDAGCGSGRVTRVIANILKKGKIYAIDLDQNMIETAKINLKDHGNVIFINSDLSTVELPEPVDIIFSNAVIHWIKDHYKLFCNFWKLLKQYGEILIQCGGKGNLETVRPILDLTRKSSRFKDYFRDWEDPWNFASAEETFSTMEKAGFKRIETSLTKKIAKFSNFEEYRLFMKTVIMKPYLSYLPSDCDGQNINSFIDCFFKHQKKNIKGFSKVITDYSIDYTRLNILANK
jgi:trans-aconitate 2-methyltransferase